MSKFKLKSFFRSLFKGLWKLTLIPYGIATYNELKTVDWMSYLQTVKVTAFVILFSVLTATIVFGVDQLLISLSNAIYTIRF